MEHPKFRVLPGGRSDRDPKETRGPRSVFDASWSIIEGGKSRIFPDSSEWTSDDLTFHSAWATDSRLMGVVCMQIQWDLDRNAVHREVHQFFHFENTNIGFDRYDSVIGNEQTHLSNVEASFIGGLGSEKVTITQREAVFLLQYYIQFNQDHGIPLPSGEEDYQFLREEKQDLTERDQLRLFQKLCKEIQSNMDLTNYFMMRFCEHDSAGIRHLAAGEIDQTFLPDHDDLTLYANDLTFGRGKLSCRTRSLIGDDNEHYWLVVSHFTYRSHRVHSFKIETVLRISSTEAFLQMSHSEFITVYDYSGPESLFRRSLSRLTKDAMIMDSEKGRTFMIFHRHNRHVNTEHYRLYEDTVGIIHYCSDGRQLVCSSASAQDINLLELDLMFSPVYQYLEPAGSYEFNVPVMGQYLQSDIPKFRDFLQTIQ
ncbi:MAG: hypothetical protein ACOYJJ_07115 [Anaerovoracaceae bacterium]|jgi:hypothetical protein